MPYIHTATFRTGVVVGLLLVTASAEAQIAPGGGMPGGGMGQQPDEAKKEGVAEAAPKAPGLLPTNPVLPAPKGRRKRWKLLELDGYFRMRTDWFKNFHLGFVDDPAAGGAPFPRALGCGSSRLGRKCDESLSSTNMRLRLEPTINLDEGTSIHVQADVLDNLVLGSTPVNQGWAGGFDASDTTDFGNRPPLGAFGKSQAPPIAGLNSDRDSIAVKRAWAEVAVPLGILKFGRMPNHWGMGMVANSGGHDPIDGSYDLDGDYGDTVDRVSFSAVIPGTQIRGMIASDWDSTRLVSNQASQGKGREGHPFDLDDEDDGNSWIIVLSRMDAPQEFRDKVERGELALNYGVYFEYRTQRWDNDVSGFTVGGDFDEANGYVPRDLKTYSPNPWVKLAYKRIQLEAEAIGQFGKIGRLDEFGFDSQANIRKYGGTARFTWKGLEGKLRLGLESGAASGDQWDNTPQGNTHIAFANLLGDPSSSDRKLSQFMFNREYKVDMILFRHLIGAVSNAGYVKPFLSYDFTKSIQFKISNITSFAMKPVATPGNSRMYGTEFNTDLGYSGGGLFAGVSYGVLFPFAAMNHPDDDPLDPDGDFGYSAIDPDNTGDAGTAHTLQLRLMLQF
ncbi:MAG: TIGR04551 family protein [Deltaproteobacteria bacterium]|nr:TIGR04551 family protein [Deltaproteobacteria bacterium]MDQ3301089.1 TIGR04551 family protein [Myxococcota bacterium]